jgi:hypothetical protein
MSRATVALASSCSTTGASARRLGEGQADHEVRSDGPPVSQPGLFRQALSTRGIQGGGSEENFKELIEWIKEYRHRENSSTCYLAHQKRLLRCRD